ncbi:MAG: hypothetical protein K6U11_01910 [bacterium]|nr:hypothetical protein [bacterium]
MFREKRYLVILLFVLAIVAVRVSVAKAQNWAALPPYNILWPLWSPVLSPPNAAGSPTPLVTSVTRNTILPVQPALVLDPTWWTLKGPVSGWPMGEQPPWLLYNTPTGLVFFDVLYGINPWPPAKYLDPTTGAPIPISLLAGYSLIDPTPATLPITQAIYLFDLANLSYLLAYGNALGVSPSSLLTAAQVFGLPPI